MGANALDVPGEVSCNQTNSQNQIAYFTTFDLWSLGFVYLSTCSHWFTCVCILTEEANVGIANMNASFHLFNSISFAIADSPTSSILKVHIQIALFHQHKLIKEQAIFVYSSSDRQMTQVNGLL